MRISFKPPDLLSLFFIALLAVLAILGSSPPAAKARMLATYCLFCGATAGLAWYRGRAGGKRVFYLHIALTVTTILFLFNSLGALIAGVHGRTTYDGALIAADYALFGVHPTVWMERLISPALTTVLQFAYISYYFIPVSLGVVLVVKGKHREFESALFGIVLCFYLSYIGYLLVPAIGPRFTLAPLQTIGLRAAPFIRGIQDFLNGMEQNKTDAFPSGHTAIALMSLYYARQCGERKLFGILLPVASALIFSTVYLRYHYVIDVIAGFILTGITIALAPFLQVRLSGASRDTGK